MVTEKVKALKQTALFGDLPESELSDLAERAFEKRLKRDEILFSAGEISQGLFVIISGSLRAFREGVDGREQVVHVERAGATIAELPVFDEGPYPSTVAAEEDSVVLFIDKRVIRSLCDKQPAFALSALKLLAGRLRKCAELVEALSLREVDQRLARWLLNEARSRGKRLAGKSLEINLVLTNQQIAARIGSVREVVSRALNRLQQNDLIVIEGRKIIITDEDALDFYSAG
ncbi:MAG: Crp/Fnr family transcriptional regulator [Acidobacteria bacterium]|nr:Crp/Fnr family transcriptional regulator [Acidobacteriota bacterium]MBK9709578.1 Crp/Fnr family transcriptional regulator [Acidobacteriota bacterium]